MLYTVCRASTLKQFGQRESQWTTCSVSATAAAAAAALSPSFSLFLLFSEKKPLQIQLGTLGRLLVIFSWIKRPASRAQAKRGQALLVNRILIISHARYYSQKAACCSTHAGMYTCWFHEVTLLSVREPTALAYLHFFRYLLCVHFLGSKPDDASWCIQVSRRYFHPKPLIIFLFQSHWKKINTAFLTCSINK